MRAYADRLFEPLADVLVDLGIRLDFLVPLVALLSMGAGILVARYGGRSR